MDGGNGLSDPAYLALDCDQQPELANYCSKQANPGGKDIPRRDAGRELSHPIFDTTHP